MNSLLELRAYTLKPGARPAFQQRFEDQVLPMLQRFGVEVVRAGPSLHDDVSFHLFRRFASEEWLSQHDAAVMAMIETYSTCVVEE